MTTEGRHRAMALQHFVFMHGRQLGARADDTGSENAQMREEAYKKSALAQGEEDFEEGLGAPVQGEEEEAVTDVPVTEELIKEKLRVVEKAVRALLEIDGAEWSQRREKRAKLVFVMLFLLYAGIVIALAVGTLPLWALALPILPSLISWLNDDPNPDTKGAFEFTVEFVRLVLEAINRGIVEERKQLASGSEAEEIRAVRALASVQTTAPRQPLPWWWLPSGVVRLPWFVVGSAVFLGDFVLFVGGWVKFNTASVCGQFYDFVVQPWVRLLVATFIKESARVAPRLDEALAKLAKDASAKEDGGGNVEFVVTGLKHQSRALVKIRDDYMTPTILAHQKFFDLAIALNKAGKRLLGPGLPISVRVLLFPVVVVAVTVFWVMYFVVTLLLFLGRPFVYFWYTGFHTSRLVDVARGSLVCDSARRMLDVHEMLMNNKLEVEPSDGDPKQVFEVVRCKNGWADENEHGYVQLLYNVRLQGEKNAVICEVQVTHRRVFEWRKFTHKPYKVLRAENLQALKRDFDR